MDLSLYIHWPFCTNKCPYCDFFSVVGGDFDIKKIEKTYILELEKWASIIGKRNLISIFFGGGTPSLMSPQYVQNLIEKAFSLWNIDQNIEITLEANPCNFNKFNDFKNAGINRISIGIQSFLDKNLKFLGRKHSAQDAISAIECAKKLFHNISIDLIYTLPKQDIEEWSRELDLAISFDLNHMSLYQLTIERQTKFFHMEKRNEFVMKSSDISCDFYEHTSNKMINHGFEHYEISNYAKSDFQCIHNMTYWRYQDYLGIGPGAHSRININAKKKSKNNVKDIDRWIDNANYRDIDFCCFDILPKDLAIEKLLMTLRITEGINLTKEILSIIALDKVNKLIQEKLIYIANNRLFLSSFGRQNLNSILSYILKI